MFFRKIIGTTLVASFAFVSPAFCSSPSITESQQDFEVKEENLPHSQEFSERIPNKAERETAVLSIQFNEDLLSESSDIEETISLTNKFREENNLSPLRENRSLNRAAEEKVKDMFEKGYFDHLSPDDITPWHWIKESGYQYKYAGENLAKGFFNNEKTVRALMRSPSHRKNILNEKYQDIGVAVISGNFKDEGEKTIIVQMFASKKEGSEILEQKDTYPEQDEIKLSIIVNPNDQSINTVLASLKYPKDDLEFLRTDKANSDFSIFLENNDEKKGILTIISLQPFPGIEKKANMIDLVFRPLKKGLVEIEFLKDSVVLANDGYGTNVLKEKSGISFEMKKALNI